MGRVILSLDRIEFSRVNLKRRPAQRGAAKGFIISAGDTPCHKKTGACNQINEYRNAQSPDHRDHVEPEDFVQPRTAQEVFADLRRSVREKGEPTAEDLATLSALYDDRGLVRPARKDLRAMLKEEGAIPFEEGEKEHRYTGKELRMARQRIMKDPDFQKELAAQKQEAPVAAK